MKGKLMILTSITILGFIVLTEAQGLPAEPTGELVLAEDQWGNEIPIPHMEISQGLDYMKLLYDPLVGTTPDEKLSTEHGVANKWEMSPDGLTWTFYIRKGVKFHDGVELTAKDVKFSLEQVMQPDSKIAAASDLRVTIKNVEVKAPHTLVVNCKKPSIFLPELLNDTWSTAALIQPKEYYERVGRDKAVKNPIGSGPYKFHSQMAGSFIKLEAINKHWWAGVPRFKYVTFRIVPEEFTRIAMLRTGEVDIVRLSREKVKEVLDAGLNVLVKENANMISFTPNMQWASPVFSDIRFRKALNLAIDKEAIIKRILGGRAKPTTNYPGMNLLVCGGDRTLKSYPYDPGEARRLIKEGGHDGHEFVVPSYTRGAAPELPSIVETLSSFWEKAGLKPKIVNLDWLTWRQSMRSQKTPNNIHGNAYAVDPECASLLNRLRLIYHSKSEQTVVKIPEIDTMIERAEKSLDRAEVSRLIGDIHRYVHQQYIDIPICDTGQDIATTQRVPKWDPGQRRMGSNINDIIRWR